MVKMPDTPLKSTKHIFKDPTLLATWRSVSTLSDLLAKLHREEKPYLQPWGLTINGTGSDIITRKNLIASIMATLPL